MPKHYEIDTVKKIIYADILALSDKEAEEVLKYQKFGFSVEVQETKKTSVKRLNEAYILDYLKKADVEALDIYEGKKKEPATDTKGNVKKTKSGNVRVKGFNNALHWFVRTYPQDVSEIKSEITRAGMMDALQKAFAEYEAENKATNGKMNENAYTRYFYWMRVFENDK